MLLALDLLSTICFGCAGASIALRNRLNYFSIVFSGFVASTGGGTVRDIAMQSEAIFWIENPSYLLAVLIAIVIALTQRKKRYISRSLRQTINSLATSVFVMVGVLAALDAGCNDFLVLMFGVLTGIGGGLVRQVVFEGRSVFQNPVNIYSALTIAMCCSVLMQLGSHVIVTIVGLAFIHFLINDYQRKSRQKNIRRIRTLLGVRA